MTLKDNCKKFNGKVVNGKCKIDKFTMSNAEFLFDYKPDSQQFKIMQPKEFLDVVPSEPFNNPVIRENLKEKIATGKEMDPLFLDVDVDTCKVLSHEGRNRAIVSQELGLKKIPVVIFNKEFDKDAVGMFGSKGVYFYAKRKNKCDMFIKQNS